MVNKNRRVVFDCSDTTVSTRVIDMNANFVYIKTIDECSTEDLFKEILKRNKGDD